MEKSLLVRPEQKIIQTCNFQTAITRKRPPPQMSTQAFFEANTLYLSNLKRNPVPLSCTQTPLQPLDYWMIAKFQMLHNLITGLQRAGILSSTMLCLLGFIYCVNYLHHNKMYLPPPLYDTT